MPHEREISQRLLQSWNALFSGVVNYSKEAAHAPISRVAWENSLNRRLVGGGGGIRTHERLTPLPVFKFDRPLFTSVQ
jgi:hypothetical protein